MGYSLRKKLFGQDCYCDPQEEECVAPEPCVKSQPNYNRLVNFATSAAFERAVENVVIDLTDPDLKFEDDGDIKITIATETYWYNHFWQLCISVLVPLWTILFAGFSLKAY